MDLTVLKSIRREQRLSQRELASRVGINRSYLSTIENGRGNPSHALVGKIFSELDYNLIILRGNIDLGYAENKRN